MLGIDNILFSKYQIYGLRLEDLKRHPEATIQTLCKWMGIKEEPSLFEMTAQGKKWWGDPSSPDFGKKEMKPFDKSSIERKTGTILSKNDQYIFKILFYPFSVSFGYDKEDRNFFNNGMKKLPKLLEGLFDFEKKLIQEKKIKQDQFTQSGNYRYLRSFLTERWKVLNEFKTYPHLLKPVKIKN